MQFCQCHLIRSGVRLIPVHSWPCSVQRLSISIKKIQWSAFRTSYIHWRKYIFFIGPRLMLKVQKFSPPKPQPNPLQSLVCQGWQRPTTCKKICKNSSISLYQIFLTDQKKKKLKQKKANEWLIKTYHPWWWKNTCRRIIIFQWSDNAMKKESTQFSWQSSSWMGNIRRGDALRHLLGASDQGAPFWLDSVQPSFPPRAIPSMIDQLH